MLSEKGSPATNRKDRPQAVALTGGALAGAQIARAGGRPRIRGVELAGEHPPRLPAHVCERHPLVDRCCARCEVLRKRQKPVGADDLACAARAGARLAGAGVATRGRLVRRPVVVLAEAPNLPARRVVVASGAPALRAAEKRRVLRAARGQRRRVGAGVGLLDPGEPQLDAAVEPPARDVVVGEVERALLPASRAADKRREKQHLHLHPARRRAQICAGCDRAAAQRVRGRGCISEARSEMRSVAFVNGRSHAAALMTTPGSAAERLLQTELFVTDVCAGATAGKMGCTLRAPSVAPSGPACVVGRTAPARAPAGSTPRRCCLLFWDVWDPAPAAPSLRCASAPRRTAQRREPLLRAG